MAINFDIKTGQVFIRNFDQGVIETMEGFIDVGYTPGNGPASGSGGGMTIGGKRCYFIEVPGLSPPKVPVVFNQPYQGYKAKFLPSFLITRGDPVPALERWHSIGNKQYRVPVGDPIAVTLANGETVSGYDEYEELVQAFPFDLPYTITVAAKYEREAIEMVKKVLSVYKPYSRILIKDSLSAIRSYTVFNEGGFTNVSELVDVADRTKAYAIEIRVEGELDLSDPVITPSAQEFILNSTVL